MRIVLVTVSNLGPAEDQSSVTSRIAAGLADRGHEVHLVIADEHTADGLVGWTERTSGVRGVRLHRLSVDARSGDPGDPRVDAAFADLLAELEPQVVHLGDVSGAGGGLVTVARAAGVPVLVSLRDGWWWCDRGTQLEPTGRPCAPVVACGVCPCTSDNSRLQRRDVDLLAALSRADLVLAGSPRLRELAVANGVDDNRLLLHPDHQPDRSPTGGTGWIWTEGGTEVRFRVAPSADGPEDTAIAAQSTVLAAAALLADLPGWTLHQPGAVPEGAPERVLGNDPDEPLVDFHVLIEPGTGLAPDPAAVRQALAAGVPVISTGSDEAVRDRHNGLLVPRADPAALAWAMRQLVTDPTLLAELRAAAGPAPIRTFVEQLDELEVAYRQVQAEPAGHRAGGPEPIRRVLLLTGIEGAPLRYRGRLPQEELAALGVRMDVKHYRDVAATSLARDTDALVLYRVPATEQVLDLIDMVRRRPQPVPVLFDIDDLVFDPEVAPQLAGHLSTMTARERDWFWTGVRRYRTTLEAGDAYLGSTEFLTAEVARLTGMPTYRYPNGVGIQLARASDLEFRRPRRPGPLRLGYLSGTATHNEDWAAIEPAVLAAMQRHPSVELYLAGPIEPGADLAAVADRVHRLPLRPWFELPKLLRDIDINLAPLAPGKTFNEAKSAIKWLEAALVGTPTIATSTAPFREAIEHDSTGLLATDLTEWGQAIDTLLLRPDRAAAIGAAARERAMLTLSPAAQGRRYLAALTTERDRIAAHGHRQQFTSCTPEWVSEPYGPIGLEDYPSIELPPVEPAPAGAAARAAMAGGLSPRNLTRVAADYRNTALDHLRRNGFVPTAKKSVRVLGRLPRRAADRLRRG